MQSQVQNLTTLKLSIGDNLMTIRWKLYDIPAICVKIVHLVVFVCRLSCECSRPAFNYHCNYTIMEVKIIRLISDRIIESLYRLGKRKSLGLLISFLHSVDHCLNFMEIILRLDYMMYDKMPQENDSIRFYSKTACRQLEKWALWNQYEFNELKNYSFYTLRNLWGNNHFSWNLNTLRCCQGCAWSWQPEKWKKTFQAACVR